MPGDCASILKAFFEPLALKASCGSAGLTSAADAGRLFLLNRLGLHGWWQLSLVDFSVESNSFRKSFSVRNLSIGSQEMVTDSRCEPSPSSSFWLQSPLENISHRLKVLMADLHGGPFSSCSRRTWQSSPVVLLHWVLSPDGSTTL